MSDVVMAAPLPIRRVNATGVVDVIGEYDVARKTLALETRGFPLLGAGVHVVEEDVPWVFDEMAPAGFLARQLADDLPDLALPRVRTHWMPEHVLRVVSEWGHDRPGNLIVGDGSWDRFRFWFHKHPSTETRASIRTKYTALVDEALFDPGGSSVGGDQPKLTFRLADGTGLIVKFTPPRNTAAGSRWADLLLFEHHVAETLRAHALDTPRSEIVEIDGRLFLEIERFDRLARGGRRGAVTLYSLGVALCGDIGVSVVPRIAAALARDGHLASEDAARIARVHELSSAIGNSDAHTGNYALLVDDAGVARVAPFYDVTAMSFAPRHDEINDDRVGPFAPASKENAPLVDELRARIERDARVSRGFVAKWSKHVASTTT